VLLCQSCLVLRHQILFQLLVHRRSFGIICGADLNFYSYNFVLWKLLVLINSVFAFAVERGSHA